MEEVFLYMCEECGTCVFNGIDRGKASYNNYCVGCKQGSFFKKVVTKNKYDMFCNYQGTCFVVEENIDDKEKGKAD